MWNGSLVWGLDEGCLGICCTGMQMIGVFFLIYLSGHVRVHFC